MPAPLTLFEYETKPFPWTERHLVLLKRVNRDAEVLRPTVCGKERALQAAQYVGVVRFGDQTVQILPKIYRDETSGEARSADAMRNLVSLFAFAGNIPLRAQDIAPLLRQTGDWFEILTRLFALQLSEMWRHQPLRHYENRDEELPVLRGKLRLAEQIRHPERQHRFAVRYDSLTADNALNRVFRFVVERLLPRTQDAENRRLLSGLRSAMEDEVTLLPSLAVTEAAMPQGTRLHRHYEPLLHLARLFLEGRSLQLSAGDVNAFAFVVDMNQLFERFVHQFLHRYRDAILPPALQSCTMQSQSAGTWFHLAHTGGRPVFRLQPDLVFRQEECFPLLLDTKYKQLDPASRHLGIAQDDFYQMHAYAHRFDCPRVLLLYPRMADLSGLHQRQFVLKESAKASKIIEVGLVEIRRDIHRRDAREALIREMKAVFAGGSAEAPCPLPIPLPS